MYMYNIVKLKGTALRWMVMSLLETGRHPMTRNPTPCSYLSSFPLKKTLCPSSVVVSPKFFHLISHFCNDGTNERGLRLLEFATFSNLVFVNTFDHHKASRRWTWHSPNGQHHNQTDYSLVRKRFKSGVNSART